MRLCTRGAVFGAYLVINARPANAPFVSVIPPITANAGLLTFITKTWNSFLAAMAPSSVRVALILVMLMSGLVAVSSAPASNTDNRDTQLFITELHSLRSFFFHCRFEACPVSADLHLWLPSSRCSQEGRGRDNPTSVAQHTAPLPCQHHCDGGESQSWKCDRRCSASGRVDKAPTELRLENMLFQHGCDSLGNKQCTSSCEKCTHCNRDYRHSFPHRTHLTPSSSKKKKLQKINTHLFFFKKKTSTSNRTPC